MQTDDVLLATHLPSGEGWARTLVRRAEAPLIGLSGALLGSVPAASDGGFFSSTWAALALVSLVVATLHLVLSDGPRLRALDWAFVAGGAALALWFGLTALWTLDLTASLDETLRAGSYAALVLGLLVVVRRGTATTFLAGLLLGVTAISAYSLLSRLHPDWLGDWDPVQMYRLTGPLGYWNGLGLYAAMGTLLALGLAARARSVAIRTVAGACPVLLVPTMLFTFSRGAWLALIVGAAAMLLVGPRRLQLVVTAGILAPWPALVLLAATRSDTLTRSDVTLAQAIDEGGDLLRWIVPLLAVAAVASLLLALASRRLRFSQREITAAGTVVAVGAVAALVVVFAAAGAPWTLVHRALDDVRATTDTTGPDQTDRLFDLSSNGRLQQWEVSVDQLRAHPIVGEGVGTWEIAWNRDRPRASAVKDAHSLYLEVLGETGVVGLVVLVAMLAVPLVAIPRARQRRSTLPAVGVYVAFLGHAAVDWDWELAGLAAVALAAAAVIVVNARPSNDPDRRALARVAAPSLTAVLALAALAAVLSTVPLAQARDAYNRLDFAEAAKQASKATDWAPWSAEAYQLLGRSQLALGQLAAARRSLATAVEKAPSDWEAYRDLAAVSSPAQADRLLARALELNPLEDELLQLRDQLSVLRSGSG